MESPPQFQAPLGYACVCVCVCVCVVVVIADLPPPVVFHSRYLSFTIVSVGVRVLCIGTVHCLSSEEGGREGGMKGRNKGRRVGGMHNRCCFAGNK